MLSQIVCGRFLGHVGRIRLPGRGTGGGSRPGRQHQGLVRVQRRPRRKGVPYPVGKVLEGAGDFAVTAAKDGDDLKAENIGKYDVVLFYGSGGTIRDPKQEQGLWNFVQQGGGIVGVHATDANKSSDVYRELLGGRFVGHGSGTYTVHIYDQDHAVTAGMSDFDISDETYAHLYHKNANMRCLVRMDRGNERQSMAWVQQHGKGRSFTTGFGDNRGAWSNPQFQRLVVRAMYWTAGRTPKDPPADSPAKK